MAMESKRNPDGILSARAHGGAGVRARDPIPARPGRSGTRKDQPADPSFGSDLNVVADPQEIPRPSERPTSRSSEIERIQQNEAGARLIAKIVRDVLAEQRFDNPTHLREAVEERCEQLRLRCTRELVERAFDLVGSNAQLLAAHRVRRRAPELPPAPPTVKHAEAKAILDTLGVDVSKGRVRRTAPSSSRLVPM